MLVPIGVIVVVALARWRFTPDDSVRAGLDWCIINVILPSVVLVKVAALHVEAAHLGLAVLAWISIGVGSGCVLLADRVLHFSPTVRTTLLLMVPLGNTSFFGLPVIAGLLGEQAVGPALVFDQLGSFLALSTYGALVAHGGGDQGWRGPARKVLTFPPFVALVLACGFALTRTPLWRPVHDVLTAIGASLVFATMATVGLRLERPQRGHLGVDLGVGLFVKMVVLPGVVLVVGQQVLAGPLVPIAVLQAGMPPMISAGILARQGKGEAVLADRLVTYGIGCALVTLPFWEWVAATL